MSEVFAATTPSPASETPITGATTHAEAPPTIQAASTPPPAQSPALSAVPEPWLKSWLKSDMTLDHKALERLPDHLKGLKPTLERQKSFEDVLTVMQNQQVLAGKKALAPLPADAPANVQAERKALLDTINGVPKEVKDYGIAKPADIPDAQWNQPLADSFASWAHKHSVPPSAARELLSIQTEAVKGQLAAQAQYEQTFWSDQQKTFDAMIRQQNIPADRAASLVEKGAIALGLDLSKESTKIMLKGADARLMAMRHALAIGEDNVVTGDTKMTESNPGDLARDAMHNKSNPLYEQYWNRDGKFPRAVQEAAVAKVTEWMRLEAAKNPPRGRASR